VVNKMTIKAKTINIILNMAISLFFLLVYFFIINLTTNEDYNLRFLKTRTLNLFIISVGVTIISFLNNKKLQPAFLVANIFLFTMAIIKNIVYLLMLLSSYQITITQMTPQIIVVVMLYIILATQMFFSIRTREDSVTP